MRKQFDKALYEAYDSQAKAKVLNILNDKWKACESPSKVAVDLMVYEGREHKFNIEVETKAVWVTDEFPYANVQFPDRKLKYCMLDKPTIFVMFNAKMNKYLSVTSKDLMNSPRVMVRNKYVRYGEEFFQVPINKVSFNDLNTSIEKLGL